MDHQLQEIGARLKQARLSRHMTQNQLAEAAEISVSFLSNLENGRQAMNICTLITLLDILNVSADWLLNKRQHSTHYHLSFMMLIKKPESRSFHTLDELLTTPDRI